MPVKSEPQRRLMEAVRHNPDFARKVGISKSVAEKFVGPKAHNDGGAVKESGMKKPLPPFLMKGKKDEKKPAKGKPFAKGGGIESKGKTKGKMVKMMGGGKC